VAIDVIAGSDFNFSRMANLVGETVSSQNSKVMTQLFKELFFLIDTDENAFEARDLEGDFHDASTTKDPASHGRYNNASQSSNLTIFLIQKVYISLLRGLHCSANDIVLQCNADMKLRTIELRYITHNNFTNSFLINKMHIKII
jgi:hypothetical protein